MPNKYIFIKNTETMNKLHITFFFNIFSLTFLTWISHRGNDVGNHNIYLNIKHNKSNTWILRNDRLLTNNDTHSDVEERSIKENLKEPEEQNILKDITESSEIHEKLKKDTSNSMHAYIKKLENGYPNKKGLKRLDCLYEKKLFGEMYKLDTISGHIKSKNSYIKKVILKRYGLRFFIFSLVLLFGIATSIVSCFTEDDVKCVGTPSVTTEGACKFCSGIGNFLYIPNSIIYIPLIIAFLSFIMYILSKVKKYKKLKRKYDNISLM